MNPELKPIGVVNSPFEETDGMPIQAISGLGIRGEILIHYEYLEGIRDLEGFSHIILIYHFHLSKKYSLKVKPFLDNVERGVFATRAPSRPNAIGLSVVRLINIEGNKLTIENVDIVNGTPLLDIKPFIPEIDCYDSDYNIGWFANKIVKLNEMRADGRFK